MNWVPVKSRMLAAVAYSNDWQQLYLRFRSGDIYCYRGVPVEERLLFGLGTATKIYIAVESVDMRKAFDGLYGLVRDRLGHDPLSGHLFLFANRERTRLKV
jgi:hypothetical protein